MPPDRDPPHVSALSERVRLRHLSTEALTANETVRILAIMTAAFGDDEEERFGDTDWEHALGGVHVLVELDGLIVAHAALVERELHVGGRPVRTGYVEAVATAPEHQGSGFGTLAIEAIDAIIERDFEIGALGTGSHHFYERLGWETWQGPAFVRAADGNRRTPDEDGFIMILRTARTPPIDLRTPISCDWRAGDVW
jgi:aminoglycoside 2'-N-acetyltransferase I